MAGEPKTPNALRTVAVSSSLSRELIVGALDRMDAGKEYLFDCRVDRFRKNHLQPLLKQLGMQPAGFHAFRHFNASLMDRLRILFKTRQVRLGHASTGSLTLDVYSHAGWEENVDAAFQIRRGTLGSKEFCQFNCSSTKRACRWSPASPYGPTRNWLRGSDLN
jgi:integrase